MIFNIENLTVNKRKTILIILCFFVVLLVNLVFFYRLLDNELLSDSFCIFDYKGVNYSDDFLKSTLSPYFLPEDNLNLILSFLLIQYLFLLMVNRVEN